MCGIQALLALARFTNIISTPAASALDNSNTPLIRDVGPSCSPNYTSGVASMTPSIASLTRGDEARLQAKLETLLDTKLREFEQRSLNPLLQALQRLEERWLRIELALDRYQEDDANTSDAKSTATTQSTLDSQSTSNSQNDVPSPPSVRPMPGSFPAFDAPSPSTSCFFATASELEEAIEVSTIRCPPKTEDNSARSTTPSVKADQAEKGTRSMTVETVQKESKPPVVTNAWTVVARTPSKPVDIHIESSKLDSSRDSGDVVWENVVERRGRRLQVLKNELRIKEDNNKLVKVDPDGMAVRSLDPRPCHRYYLGKL
ncbi:hypothetical protein QFC20_000886 [Naganishia adeliensis]|uniref:Uncharacterized protein n=1 Tax=Naganishia adeliensis TaxID=92952 RepID=A0ACC2WWP7_9TREE|nr:hypothetical protein QFC20_000886 [Naganishia adeliensis]